MNPFLDRSEPPALRRTWGQRFVLILNLVLIGASLMLAGLLSYANDKASAINRVALDRSLTEVPEVESGGRVINILLVGSDSSANLDPDDPIQVGRQGERLGDVIIVAHLDERSGRIALLSLPRDLWVPIAGSEREDRINRSFLVGGAAKLIDTIEENFGIPIHHYVNVDFAGFQGLVEAVGSVEVYFETPARDWNVNAQPEPKSQTGFLVAEAGCHSLGPEQALAYVRSRYYQTQNDDGRWVTDPTSDLGRIQRQQDFLQKLMQKAISLGARNPLVLGDLIDTGVENVAIDSELTPSLLIDMSGTFRSFEPGDLQTYTYPAVDGRVGANRVLIPQADAAAPVLELFMGQAFDDPVTVGVSVLYDSSFDGGAGGPTRLPASVAATVEVLEAAGFDVADVGSADTGGGFTIRHGPDGRQAAEVLLAGLGNVGREPTLEEVGSLVGRNVIVVFGADMAADGGTGTELVAPGLDSQDLDREASDDQQIDQEPSPTGPEVAFAAPEGPTKPQDGCG